MGPFSEMVHNRVCMDSRLGDHIDGFDLRNKRKGCLLELALATYTIVPPLFRL